MRDSLLSRVAEHFYWFGRYIERAENTARLIIANVNLSLDLPGRARLDWYALVEITGSEYAFEKSVNNPTEPGVLRFLISEKDNPGSIRSSLRMARENLRTTRDRVPREVSESVNRLYELVDTKGEGAIRRTAVRFELLRAVIDSCQQLRGYLAGTMSRGLGFHFLRCGQMLERADMTTRIMDVRLEDLIPDDMELPPAAEAIQWMAVLRSLSAYQMYRRDRQGVIKGRHVIDFLLLDELFPRSVFFAMQQFRDFAGALPRSEAVVGDVDRSLELISSLHGEVLSVDNARLHKTLDDLQGEILRLHGMVAQTYFQSDIH